MTMTFDAPEGRIVQNFGHKRQNFNGLQNSLLTKVIEGEIIPRLLLAHHEFGQQSLADEGDGEFISPEIFARLVLASDSEEILDHVRILLDRGIAIDRIFLDLLAPVARKLGEMWVEDTCSFTDVTLALSRLHRVLHEVGRLGGAPPQRSDQYNAFFAPVPGEQHTFGISVLEEFFQHAGWETRCEYNPSTAGILEIAGSKSFDVIGFSVGCEELLDLLSDLVLKTRKASLNRDVTIMVGGGLFIDNRDLGTRFGNATIISDGVNVVQVAEEAVSRVRGTERKLSERTVYF